MLVRFDVDVAGQTLALERVLCAVRRRAFEIRWLRFRSRVHDAAEISFAIDVDEREAERLEANLWKLHEVRAVKRKQRQSRRFDPMPVVREIDSATQRACHSV